MKLSKNTLLIVLAGLMVLSVAVQAQPPGPGRGGNFQGGPAVGRMAMWADLNLSDDQLAQLNDLRFDHQKKMIDVRADIRKEQLELQQLQRAAKPNIKKINAQIEKLGDYRVKMQKLTAEHRLSVRSILTPEQLKIYLARAPMMQNSGRGRGNCGGMLSPNKGIPPRGVPGF